MMNAELKPVRNRENHIVCGHKPCKTGEAQWLCIEKIYEKLNRPSDYDIGGTYVEDVADYWFKFKSTKVGKNCLLHLFVTSHQPGDFDVALSDTHSEFLVDRKSGKAYLPTCMKIFNIKEAEKNKMIYLLTYSFDESEVEILQNKKFYIAMSFQVSEKNVLESVKADHDFGALLTDPVGADFTIESADGEKFNVHKHLLIANSDVFEAMLKEHTAQSQNNYVELVDVVSDDVQCILEFMYTGTIKNLDCNWYNLLLLGDRYNIQGLRILAQHALAQELCADNAVDMLIAADKVNSDLLRTASLKFIKFNPESLQNETFKMLNDTELLREICENFANIS